MQATTSGVIHKNDVLLSNEYCKSFLNKQKEIFESLIEKRNVVYDKNTTISDASLNYLNTLTENKNDKALKNMILREYYACENLFPYLGDLFLHKLFSGDFKIKRNTFGFEKRYERNFIESLKNPQNRNIARWFFENCNLNRNINIEKYKGTEFIFEFTKDFVFDLNFDIDFYSKNKIYECKNYKYVIINGFIDTVGELHHLFYKAHETKIPHVIFCMGMHEEVKKTIIQNNNMGKFHVYPVCLNINDEYSLNIFNDIAVIHGGTIVSSDLGQTISQEVRKDLNEGNYICINQEKVIIRSNVSDESIQKHRVFLKNRIDEALVKPDVRVDVLQKRLKMFTDNKLNIYLPELFLKDKDVTREVDYLFRFLGFLNKKIKIVEMNNQKFYFPNDYINISEIKQKSLRAKFAEISALIS